MVRVKELFEEDKPRAQVVGWDPTRGVVCEGHPTVMVFNMSDGPMTIEMGDVVAQVCPIMEITRYYKAREGEDDQNDGRGARRVISVVKEAEVSRPTEFPEFLWQLVAPEDKGGVQEQFDSYNRPGDLAKNIDVMMYGLKVYQDNRVVDREPWKASARKAPIEPGQDDEQATVTQEGDRKRGD